MHELSSDVDVNWIHAVGVMYIGGIATAKSFFEIQFQSYIETFDKKTKLPHQCS